MNWLQFALLPMFLFSGTFYPITMYPDWLQSIIMATPLWQAIAMMRALAFGIFDGALLVHVAYLLALALVGLTSHEPPDGRAVPTVTPSWTPCYT